MEEFWNSLFARFPSQSQPLLRAVSAVFWNVYMMLSTQHRAASSQLQPSMHTAQGQQSHRRQGRCQGQCCLMHKARKCPGIAFHIM